LNCTLLGTGTSQGIPVIGCACPVCASQDPRDKRLRVSCYLDDPDSGKKILIDIGPDFRQQMLSNAIADLDAVLLTHEHNDHVAGLDDVRSINFKFNKDMPIYGLARVLQDVKTRFHYAFKSNKYPGVPQLDLIEVNEDFNIGSLKICPIPVMHGRLPILGYRIHNFAYVTDASFLSASSVRKLQDLEYLVLNALRITPHHSHFNLEEALATIDKIKPKHCYLTHISHLFNTHEEIEKSLPANVSVGYDGLQFKTEALV